MLTFGRVFFRKVTFWNSAYKFLVFNAQYDLPVPGTVFQYKKSHFSERPLFKFLFFIFFKHKNRFEETTVQNIEKYNLLKFLDLWAN
jgi:hypothetical protein